MKYFQLFIIAVFFTFSLASNAFPIPDDNEVSFDVIRKNKVIGNLTSKFIKDDENIVLHSVLDINIKILFFPAYKFFQETKETWRNEEFISIDGFTDFEDDREYKIDGKDEDGVFRVTGMDGLLELDEKIIPLNYWNKNILSEKYTLNATKNLKDKGPFPEYTLWYYNDELLKMEFKNPNDKKNTITIIRNDWE